MEIALESTVISHGFTKPKNIEVAFEMVRIAEELGCIAKIIGIVKGKIKIGLTKEEIHSLALREDVLKVGVREIPIAIAKRGWASTTVSATLRIASMEGIKVFATGGIGGVHEINNWDVSQDIVELSRTEMIVVSAGPKSILNLQATNEMLETFGVTVIGFKTDEMPAFYGRHSSIPIVRVNTTEEIVAIFEAKKSLGIPGAVLVFNQIPEEYAIPNEKIKEWLKKAREEVAKNSVIGKNLTPFILKKLAEYSNGQTVKSNIELLKNNIRLACEVALLLEKTTFYSKGRGNSLSDNNSAPW